MACHPARSTEPWWPRRQLLEAEEIVVMGDKVDPPEAAARVPSPRISHCHA
ncbi:hypothetical protein [Arthrobacter sp. zg-Y179]|uniref:hypothetical protein n=1 Tax=Arthrobacter sp. zg-Y179 TaxID=2894188 RepID=UPI001E5D9C85|nr:hypothetical protein [Arthrobacter sp. zg-Y179]MCC9175766.1 hypothetical protein [Arthrobacter sp. zg-Y179]